MENTKKKNEYLKNYRANPINKARHLEVARKWAKAHPRSAPRDRTDALRAYDKRYRIEYYQKFGDRLNERAKDYARSRRLRCLIHYGGDQPQCACCAETRFEFLAIDHIAGGGTQQRKQVRNIVPWIIRNDFPAGFRVLCHNCNQAIGFYGACPHVVIATTPKVNTKVLT